MPASNIGGQIGAQEYAGRDTAHDLPEDPISGSLGVRCQLRPSWLR